jgi:hypothetical protein
LFWFCFGFSVFWCFVVLAIRLRVLFRAPGVLFYIVLFSPFWLPLRACRWFVFPGRYLNIAPFFGKASGILSFFKNSLIKL